MDNAPWEEEQAS